MHDTIKLLCCDLTFYREKLEIAREAFREIAKDHSH